MFPIGTTLNDKALMKILRKAQMDQGDMLELRSTTEKKGKKNFEAYQGEVDESRPHLRHGRGACIYRGYRLYEGWWKDGHPYCRGRFSISNGSYYEGEFKDGERLSNGVLTFKRHGHGVQVWPNGDKFVGEYKDGCRHGEGVKSNKAGKVISKGTWD